MAQSLMCPNRNIKGEPCGECPDCRKNNAHTHPDLIEIGKNGIKVAVDDVRRVRDEAYLATNEAQNKVFLFHDAHKLNPESQNALLKILEEPPSHVKFILCTPSLSPILPTVRSRLYTVYEKTSDVDVLQNTLREIFPSLKPDMAKKIAVFATNYDIADIKAIDANLFSDAFELAYSFYSGETSNAILQFPKPKEKRESFIIYLQVFLLCLHEIMYTRMCSYPDPSALTHQQIDTCTPKMSSKRACILYTALENALDDASSIFNQNISAINARLCGII